MPRFLFLLIAVLLFSVETLPAKTLHVAQSGNGGDGLTWETAFPTVTEAISNATHDDHIWVKEGLYIENVVLIPGVFLYGGFVGTESTDEFDLRDWKEQTTILSGPSSSDISPEPIVTGADGTLIDGFSLRFGSRGVLCRDASMEVKNCYIHHNSAGEGTGIRCDRGRMIVEDSVFHRNQGWIGVGAFFTQGSHGILRNCLFYVHWTGLPINPGGGGVIETFGIDNKVEVEHCTLGYNQLGEDYEGIVVKGGQVSVRNSIIMGRNRLFNPDLSSLVVEYSRIEDVSGEGNVQSDPVFIPGTATPYRLQASSPCIDAAMGSTLTLDLDGNPRPVDVLGAGHDGPGAFDMGCYEFQLKKADFNRNGTVDGEDLLFFQEEWMREGSR
ncbi:MAG: hypothetical protein H6752_01415 [Candidatus Omnitrophica bacterium]|nr:hypothetical protein [Candidatus Omnitrophota bacterium]